MQLLATPVSLSPQSLWMQQPEIN